MSVILADVWISHSVLFSWRHFAASPCSGIRWAKGGSSKLALTVRGSYILQVVLRLINFVVVIGWSKACIGIYVQKLGNHIFSLSCKQSSHCITNLAVWIIILQNLKAVKRMPRQKKILENQFWKAWEAISCVWAIQQYSKTDNHNIESNYASFINFTADNWYLII